MIVTKENYRSWQPKGGEEIVAEEFTGEEKWYHYCSPRDILRAVEEALEEAADSRHYLPSIWEFTAGTTWLRVTAKLIAVRAKDFTNDTPDDETVYEVVSELCLGLLLTGRILLGTPMGTNRLDYLLYYLANKSAAWVEVLKRRKEWLPDGVTK